MVYSRGQFHHWCFQVKIKAAANVSYVTDEMMHACGGAGYKKELGRSVQRSNRARNNRHTVDLFVSLTLVDLQTERTRSVFVHEIGLGSFVHRKELGGSV